jgi:two-component system phosphate regulon sensor histidine kinase PhoR
MPHTFDETLTRIPPELEGLFTPQQAELLLTIHHEACLWVDPTTARILWLTPRARHWLNFAPTLPTAEIPTLTELWQVPQHQKPCLPYLSGGSTPQRHTAYLPGENGTQPLLAKVKPWVLHPQAWLLSLTPFQEDVALTAAYRDFVSMVSHEFRTPLTSIKGFADTLLRFGSQAPPEQTKRFLTIIKEQADRLNRMVEQVLAVSRLGSGAVQYKRKPTDVVAMLKKLAQALKAKHGDICDITLTCPAPVCDAWADPDQLEQILLNLLDNAVKYSPPTTVGQPVAVEVTLTQPKHDAIAIAIADKGVGIAAEHLPKLFNRFSRLDNPLTQQVEGTGLGLYITKALTLAMEGTIEVASTLGKGSTFTVTLPVATRQRQEAYRRQILV